MSCPAANSCTAVGTGALVEHWNGTAWSAKRIGTPAGSRSVTFNGVSCHTANLCTTVGSYEDTTGATLTLAEQRISSTWTIQSTTNPGTTSNELTGVSCHTATVCTAVGNYENSSGATVTLAEYWNGSTWTTQSTPNPVGVQSAILTGVSCALATSCTAVGSSVPSAGTSRPLAEHWTGSTWVIQPTPIPAGSKGTYLTGDSCALFSSCTTAGWFYTANGQTTNLIEAN